MQSDSTLRIACVGECMIELWQDRLHPELMRRTAELAERLDVRLHTQALAQQQGVGNVE